MMEKYEQEQINQSKNKEFPSDWPPGHLVAQTLTQTLTQTLSLRPQYSQH